MVDNKDCWIKGVRTTNTVPGVTDSLQTGVLFWRSFRDTLQDSYIYGPTTAAIAGAYSTALENAGQILLQNNIWHSGAEGIIPDGPYSNTVIAYNYFVGDNSLFPSITPHGAGDSMNLNEGNIGVGFRPDCIRRD